MHVIQKLSIMNSYLQNSLEDCLSLLLKKLDILLEKIRSLDKVLADEHFLEKCLNSGFELRSHVNGRLHAEQCYTVL